MDLLALQEPSAGPACADEAKEEGLRNPAPEDAHHLLCPAPPHTAFVSQL